ncbi:MAG: ribosome small subunit-dependent GTPase A [Pseudomonadota bacterium]
MSTDPTKRGRVVANFGRHLSLRSEGGTLLKASARRKLGLVVCGDRVSYRHSADEAIVETVEAREGVLARPDRRGVPKPLAAHLDQLIIVSAHRPGVDRFLIDSYLVTAENMGVDAVLLFNKDDLADGEVLFDETWCYYEALGYCCLKTSVETGLGLETLDAWARDRTSILVGQSGVGKSSLLQYLLPDQSIQVGALSEASGLGSHTTTTTILYQLPRGGDLIDSPGVREFATWTHDEREILHGFRELDKLGQQCRFHNCRHLKEPGCAVKSAVETGECASWRLESYRTMLERAGNAQREMGLNYR